MSTDDFEYLGCPCGTDVSTVNAFVARKLENSCLRARRVSRLPEAAQASYALLRFCVIPSAIFYARSAGPLARDALTAFDNAVMTSFCTAALELSGDHEKMARLPTAAGGLGLKRTADLAAVYRAAATHKTLRLATSLLPPGFDPIAAGTEPFFAASVTELKARHPNLPHVDAASNDVSANVPLERGELAAVKTDVRPAWLRSLLRDDQQLRLSLAGASLVERARAQSAMADHASAWLAPRAGSAVGPDDWLTNNEFCTLVRLRLGLYLRTPDRCPMCDDGVGCKGLKLEQHALHCGTGMSNVITRHNYIRDVLFALCDEAGLGPRREFAPLTDPTRRIDLVIKSAPGHGLATIAIDATVYNPLSQRYLLAAAGAPGGATVFAASNKRRQYPNAVRDGVVLKAFGLDALGAFGKEAFEMCSYIGRQLAAVRDTQHAPCTAEVKAAVSRALAQQTARMLIARMGTLDKLPPASVVPVPATTLVEADVSSRCCSPPQSVQGDDGQVSCVVDAVTHDRLAML